MDRRRIAFVVHEQNNLLRVFIMMEFVPNVANDIECGTRTGFQLRPELFTIHRSTTIKMGLELVMQCSEFIHEEAHALTANIMLGGFFTESPEARQGHDSDSFWFLFHDPLMYRSAEKRIASIRRLL